MDIWIANNLPHTSYSPPTRHFLSLELGYICSQYRFTPRLTSLRTSDTANSPMQLLSIDGALPVLYNGTMCSVPIAVTYFDGYPRRPPSVQLSPVAYMTVAPSEFVLEDGTVFSALIHNWGPHCNTQMLFNDLTAAFAYRMPLVARTVRNSQSERVLRTGLVQARTGTLRMAASQVFTPLASRGEKRGTLPVWRLQVIPRNSDVRTTVSLRHILRPYSETLRECQLGVVGRVWGRSQCALCA